MLSRSLDEIYRAASVLPDHLAQVGCRFSHDPATLAALERLRAALAEARAALKGDGRES